LSTVLRALESRLHGYIELHLLNGAPAFPSPASPEVFLVSGQLQQLIEVHQVTVVDVVLLIPCLSDYGGVEAFIQSLVLQGLL